MIKRKQAPPFNRGPVKVHPLPYTMDELTAAVDSVVPGGVIPDDDELMPSLYEDGHPTLSDVHFERWVAADPHSH
ncbi:hypothetical protein LJC60_05630 [Ruminococcaceae bacterium OttesenSCG-928-D13]|nr:hypothetical protein [Ruminococcaceae bacterium OttesenSCG-928-D13]